MKSSIVLLSIHKEHADNIYSGIKRAELRKSFAKDDIKLVFLYETKPSNKVTGCFFVKEKLKLPVNQIISLAKKYGVPEERTLKYFSNYGSGWIVLIERAIKFSIPIDKKELGNLDHYFRPPMTFAYLYKYEGITQSLMSILYKRLEKELNLIPINHNNYDNFSKLVLEEVSRNYQDIDKTFVKQTFGEKDDSNFSTKLKQVFEVKLFRSITIGYTVLTLKRFKAIKTGPTIIEHAFRNLGLGVAIRHQIYKFCEEEFDINKIYCTAPSDKPHIVNYLLNSGMKLEAKLKRHLHSNRDEYVFGLLQNKILNKNDCQQKLDSKYSHQEKTLSESIYHFIDANFSNNYFEIEDKFKERLQKSLEAYDNLNWKYADKPKTIVTTIENNEIKVVSILTFKRSNMLKINLITNHDETKYVKDNLSFILEEFSEIRRFYLTISDRKLDSIITLSTLGFELEGLIEKPFNLNSNHLAFGKNIKAVENRGGNGEL